MNLVKIITLCGLLLGNLQGEDRSRLGGALTVDKESRFAFGISAPTIPISGLRDFAFGNKMFNTNWVTAPSSVKSLDGLGPLFNRVACSQCHLRDGQGRAPHGPYEMMDSMLVRFSVKGTDTHGGPKGHAVYGGQLSDRAILSAKPEARVRVNWTEVSGHYPDGKTYTLRKPQYKFEFNYGDPGEFMYSPRVAPAVFGLGLLEAVDAKNILANEDVDDKDKDGISGKANYGWDAPTKKMALGRFGWKATSPTLLHQNSGAALGDMGLTSTYQPEENHATSLVALNNLDDSKEFDISEKQLARMTFYVRNLSVPARRYMEDEQALLGEKLFKQVNCNTCHVETFTTSGTYELEHLRNQKIYPYSDMLLHDMGEDLADNRPDFLANGKEWRTQPLWGIGLHGTVNGNDFYLHDGRARTIEEAILWHGGESEKSRDAFKALTASERQALLKFLKSL
ncbi:MAG: hypothetical protein NE330_17420 [Lentisphaeraceae bacterium]|nr:hypothetical protein [Lentisphaeraceae bacterium]